MRYHSRVDKSQRHSQPELPVAPVLVADYPPFRPSKLMKSAHLQTVGAFLISKQPKYSAVKHIVTLHDEDRLVVHDDKPASWITGDRIAILVHGLCGSHRSPCVARTASKLNRRGIRTIRVDMRGCGDSKLISKLHMHGGNYRDAMSVIEFVHQISPLSKISLVGFSIGGNIVLKTLGIWGKCPHPQVDSAVAIAPPIDLRHCSWNLRQHGNRLYESYFVRCFQTQLAERRRRVKDLIDNDMTRLPSRLVHWDDQFTAPCWGYRGALDYYEDASSGRQLNQVNVPTIILTSQDDPVVPFEMYGRFEMSEYIDLISPKQGGHLGFYSQGARDPDRFWLDWRICQWVTSLDDQFNSTAMPQKPSRRRKPATTRKWR